MWRQHCARKIVCYWEAQLGIDRVKDPLGLEVIPGDGTKIKYEEDRNNRDRRNTLYFHPPHP